MVVSTSGVHLDPDGYAVSVDGGPVRSVAIDGSVTFSGLAAGPHAVELTGLALNCALPTPDALTVSVGGTGTTTLEIEVECGQLLFYGLIGINEHGIDVVETVTHSVVAHIPVSASGRVNALVVAPGNARLYALMAWSNSTADTVYVVDVETLGVLGRVGVDGAEQRLGIARDGGELYVPAMSAGTLVIETATNTVVAHIPTNRIPVDVAVSPVSDEAWISGHRTEHVDLQSRRILREFDASGPVEVTGDGERLYVMGFNELHVLDAADMSTIQTVQLSPLAVEDMVLSVDESALYMGNRNTGIDVYDTSTFTRVDRWEMHNPARLVVSPDGAMLYVSTTLTPVLQRVSLESGAVFPHEMNDGARGIAITTW